MRNCLLLLLLISIQASLAQNTYNYTPPASLSDNWHTKDLRLLTKDTTLLYKLFTQLPDGDHELRSTLVVKNGVLLLEEYFKEGAVNKQQDLRSATKSVRSLLIGIAIDKGYIESLDDPIQKYLGNLKPEKNIDTLKEQITIRHLLTMSAGWDCNDRDAKSEGQEDRIYRKKDWLQYALDLPMINEPGAVTNYCSIGTVLLMQVLSSATNMPVDFFAAQYLFEPLGISNYSWGHTSKKEVIPAAKRLYMTPRDMAKIGQLVLEEGRWNKQQIVSKSWIEIATKQHTQIDGSGYGFLWWMTQFPNKTSPLLGFAASGNGGQYIVIFPSEKLIFVFTGEAYNSPKAQLPIFIMRDVFIPTFVNLD
ncbi:MAG: serine hydrolase [Gilvibacter sp.]